MATYESNYAIDSSGGLAYHHPDHQRQLRKPGLSINVGDANRGRVSPHQQHQQQLQHQHHQQQLQQQGYADPRYGYEVAQNEAHDIMEGDESPVDDSGDEVEEALRGGRGQHQYHHHEQDLQGDQGMEHDGEGEEEDLDDDAGSFSDSLSSSPSIPDEDIDFNLVYALHTFLATVDGQASVVKGDKLLLLDDSNSYWWLVRVLKTQAIGYIPAENIETPWERLARLNKHRNVDLTSATQQDVITGPTSTVAQTRFVGRIPPSQQPHPHASQHPTSKGVLASPSHKDHPRNMSPIERAGSSKAKTVLFTAPTYYAHSATGETTEDEDEEMYEEGEEGEGEEGVEYDEEMDEEGDREGDEDLMRGEQVFEDEDDDDDDEAMAAAGGLVGDRHRGDSEFSDDGEHDSPALEEDLRGAPAAGAAARRSSSLYDETRNAAVAEDDGHLGGDEAEDEERAKRSHWEREREQAMLAQQQAAAAEAQWARERALSPQNQPQQQSHRALSPQNPNQQQQPYRQPSPQQQRALNPYGSADPAAAAAASGLAEAYSPTQRSAADLSSSASHRIDANDFDPDAPTKKLTATPPIVRDPTFDINDPYGERVASAQGQVQPRSDSVKSPSPTPMSPIKVRGVEIVDPRDPKFNRMLQPTKRAGEEALYENVGKGSLDFSASGHAPSVSGSNGGHEADTSLNSMDTTSSFVSSSQDGGNTTVTPSSSKKQKRQSGDGGDGGDKKRKTGGLLGLFRKKDKKKKTSGAGGADKDDGGEPRSSEDSARVSPTLGQLKRTGSASPASEPRSSAERSINGVSPANKRESTTAESMFSTDAALRQQELEAKQALYHQYGVQRGPGDVTNTMTPRAAPGSNRNSLQVLNSAATGGLNSPGLAPPQRMRPGSLIGSPSIPGLEVPLLSVLRVFAGQYVEAEATFKTVLLNQGTTAADLVKQAMQRFRLTGHEVRDEYFLTVKELGGDERPLQDDDKPLGIFEELSEKAGGDTTFAVPSVKRSSVGSITSISSNLSLNPAITRLGMNDWSDDSAVKFYLNRRVAASTGDDSTARVSFSELDSTITTLASDSTGSTQPSPSYRFAVRLVIHPSDLPENVVFDPHSSAIIPKTVLLERQQRGGYTDSSPASPGDASREKVVFFPKNVNVSEVIEAGLDRFGIVDGVVDGGDEVEDRVSRRRSITRVKYSLAVEKEGRESLLNASSKLLDAYSTPPLFKAYDRSSKEFKRRSVDATLILGTHSDVQPTDPVFIIRRSASRGPASRTVGPIPHTIDELEERQQHRQEEEQQRAASPQATPREIIAAQRAASRANQRAILSAQKNSDQGIDINVPGQGTIRSVRGAEDEVRYSFINQDGTEVDISEIVENEWGAQGQQQLVVAPDGRRSNSRSSRYTVGAASTDADSFKTATDSLREDTRTPDVEIEQDDQQAIDALKSTPVDIDLSGTGPYQRLKPASSSASLGKKDSTGEDVLQDALGPRPVTSPVFNESLQERLDRVLAKVKEDKARRAASPAGSNGRPRSFISGSATPSGRASPAVSSTLSGRMSPLNATDRRSPSVLSNSQGRRSPYGNGGRDSPSIDQIMTQGHRSQAASSRQGHHGKKPSVASISSAHSTATTGTDQPSTPITGSSAGHAPSGASFTPASSATSNHRPPLVYRDDFGLDTLVTIVDAESAPSRRPSVRAARDPAREAIFGRELNELDLHPDVQQLYEAPAKAFSDLDSQLDALLLQLSSPHLVSV
ncbi:hypothetical protein JCM1840_001248 [Sporobolomyces johnsonii]